MEKLNQQINLSDGRKLGFAEYGTENGYPIIYFHGSQSSRLEMHYDFSFAFKHDLRIITVDRPGHGLSDFNAKGTILSFAEDVNQLTNHLGLSNYSVSGMSAGSPFALGFAYLYSKNINKMAIISGFAPLNSKSKKFLNKEVKLMLSLAKNTPFLLRILLKIQAKNLSKKTEKTLKGFLKIMSEPDQIILKNKDVMNVIKNMFVEAFKQGGKGVAYEISRVLVNDWEFELNNITVPTTFWQGELDNNVPLKWAQLMNKEISCSNLITFPNEGHLIIFSHAEEIFKELKIN